MKRWSIGVALLAIVVAGCGEDKGTTPIEQNPVPGFGIARTFWQFSSQPATIDTTLSERAHVAWFNPIDGVPVTEIWDHDIGTGESSVANVLEIHFKPVDHKYVRDTVDNIIDSVSVPIAPEKSWAGITADLPLSLFGASPGDIYFKIRLRTGGAAYYAAPCIMHFELGQISEDIDGDHHLDAENPDPSRVISEDEDVGLDGLANQDEFGYDPANGVYDPTGDDFDINNIWRANGTEGNLLDPEKRGHADTEDPNFNGLEIINRYRSFAIDLSDTLAPHSFYLSGSMNEAGWYTVVIPFMDAAAADTVVGDSAWREISQLRIWFDSATTLNMPPDGYTIEIADIEMIMSGWSSVVIPADPTVNIPHFGTAFISAETDSRYTPPPAYTPSYQILTSALATGKTLGLSFHDLQGGFPGFDPDVGLVLIADTVMAERRLPHAVDLRQYCWLDTYVWGSPELQDDSIMFFFRFGSSDSAYYEYRSVVRPGWDPGNHVHADLIELEELTAEFLADRASGLDSSLIRFTPSGNTFIILDSQGHNPYTGSISYMAAGIVNLDRFTLATGEAWINGIRLTGTRF